VTVRLDPAVNYHYTVNAGENSILASQVKWCDHIHGESGKHNFFDSKTLNLVATQMSTWRRDLPWKVERVYDEACTSHDTCTHTGKEGGILFETKRNHERFDVFPPVVGQCKERMTSFGANDEEKRVCGNLNVDSSRIDKKCTVISIGSNGHWSFERDIISKTECQVETFDCTGTWEVPADLLNRVTLHNICIGPADKIDGDRKYNQWDSILNH
jgi:hypothetical protein